ncbi:ABC transporter ATP-binding protein [Acidovorax cavernicola]|uniref:ABC transporter ATP-binding protein n=1 Tax=Acidovorax cavernicola TaxID=1675792 RepID=A0A9X8D7D4_9BURK|nr:ABC transporter ATP-binding protein [Acidovorax cavernicola]RIX83227.1 ABC transporter ATP-binding protein [Acidovorax cavernicola]
MTRSSSPPLLSVRGLDTFYGSSQILFDLSLEVARGESVALLGRNGAGKSTTMKSIMRIAPPRHGTVAVAGQEVSRLRPDQIAHIGLGYVPEDRQVFKLQSVEGNLRLGMKKGPQGRDDWPLERLYELFPLLAEARHKSAGLLSGGQQQMLAIARALAGNPELLLLDEPSEGLAPVIMDQIQALILQLRAQGMTLLVAEQNMRFCLDIASSVAVIDHGSIVFTGSLQEFRANPEVASRYLAV